MTHHTDAERAEFEAAIRATMHDAGEDHIAERLERWPDGAYKDRATGYAWWGYQKAARRAPAAHSTWKDHDTAKLVNDLRECAVQYHAAGQLRERIAHLVRPLAARLACAPAAPVPLRKPTVDQVSAEIGYHASAWDCVDPRELIDAILMLAAAPQPPEDKNSECWCESCRPLSLTDMRFIVCPDCGNKRCPRATNHVNACTNSNAPGQKGSSWEHVKPAASSPQPPEAAPVQLPEPAIPGSQGVCCGNFTTGGYYMGQHEQVCCGCPDDAHPPYYTEQQVRELLANHGIQEQST